MCDTYAIFFGSIFKKEREEREKQFDDSVFFYSYKEKNVILFADNLI